MAHLTWRQRARPIVAEVLAATAGQSERAIRAALRDAYPFGERRMHPYKAWLDEVRWQRGLRKPKKTDPAADERQLGLFGEEG
jgi:hypothetical protein